ncbi:MAG: AraC family transcriptional regulator [Gammaproteobacteria bacterium]
MAEQHSTLATAAKLIALTLKDYGIDAEDLFDQAGIDLAAIDNTSARFPANNMQRLWRLVLEKTGDPCFGIAVGEHIQPGAMHGVGFAWLASDTLYDALTRLIRYQRVLSTAAKFRLEEDDGAIRFVANARKLRVDIENATLEMALVLIVRMCRLASASGVNPDQVSLRRSKPECAKKIEEFFQSPIEYEAEENSLCFDKENLLVSLPNANPALARANDQVVIEYLDRFDRSQISMQVRARIIEALPSGNPTQSDIAKSLNLSLRNLQRKLQAENTNYKTLLDDTRKELATNYMRETHRSIGEITYLLGFAETSNFTRAFRRWTGKSPKEYRQLD